VLRSHDTKVRVQPGLHLFVLVRSTGAFYDALPIDEKFLAVARRVNGSAAITVKEGLRSAGCNTNAPYSMALQLTGFSLAILHLTEAPPNKALQLTSLSVGLWPASGARS